MVNGKAYLRNSLIHTTGELAIGGVSTQIAGHSNNLLYNAAGGSLHPRWTAG